MIVSIVCKLVDRGLNDFIKPISNNQNVSEVKIFRDEKGMPDKKIKYIIPTYFVGSDNLFFRLLKTFEKFFLILLKTPSTSELIYGIYELPHGLLALIVGKIRNINICVSLISNPSDKKLRVGLRKKLMYLVLRNVDFVTVCGSKSKSILVNNGVKVDKIIVLPNVVDPLLFFKTSDKKKYDIISIAYFVREKRIDIMLEVISQLKNKFPNLRVAIAGSGPHKKNIEKLSEKLGLCKTIDFVGWKDNPCEFYNQSKIFLLTSETEGLPRTVLESMACGTPCVVSDVGDIKEVAINGYNSSVVQPFDNIASYSKEIEYLLKNSSKLLSYSKNSRTHVLKNNTLKNSEEVWSKILQKFK